MTQHRDLAPFLLCTLFPAPFLFCALFVVPLLSAPKCRGSISILHATVALQKILLIWVDNAKECCSYCAVKLMALFQNVQTAQMIVDCSYVDYSLNIYYSSPNQLLQTANPIKECNSDILSALQQLYSAKNRIFQIKVKQQKMVCLYII